MKLDPKKLARFDRWLRARYTDATADKYVRDVRTQVENDGIPPKSKKKISRLRDYRLAYDVWEAWGEGGPLPTPRPVVPDQSKIRGGRKVREPKFVHERVSYPRSEYDAIVRAAEAEGGLEARTIVVVARTGLRISDVLRAPLGDLRAAMRREDGLVTMIVKGGKPVVFSTRGDGTDADPVLRAWRALLTECEGKPSSWHIAAAMMNDPDAEPRAQKPAYERVRKTLERIGAATGASGRVHLHRFRRSVGVYLAIIGTSIDQIQKTLGQENPETARSYIDESRARESARLLGKI